MRVHEVSLVDRAANKRRFLLTKKDEEMGQRLVADGRGGYVLKADSKTNDEEAKTKEKEAEKEEASKAKAKDAEKEKAGEGDEEEDDAEKEKGKGKGKIPPQFQKSEMLAALAERILDVAKTVQDGEEIPDTFGAEIASMTKKALGVSTTDDDYRKSLDAISKSIDSLRDSEPRSDTAKSDGDARFAQVTQALEELTSVAKQQKATIEKQSALIDELRSAPGTSNSIPVDKNGNRQFGDDGAWPLDMNNEITREKAEKRGVSFFDD